MTRKPLAAVAVLAAAALLLTACGSGSTSPGSTDRALRVAVATDASSLDPIRGSTTSDQQLLYPMYDTLISHNLAMDPEPGLAESWEYVTPTELKLSLREGVVFHDGTPFNAEAVKYNVERGQEEGSVIVADLASIEEVRIDDEYTATLLLSGPDASLLMLLTDRPGMMVSPTAAEAAGGDLSTDPVGAGGWKFTEWRSGEVLRLERFDDYWDTDSVRVPAIDFNVLVEPQTRANSLIGGQQDIALDIATPHVDLLRDADDATLFESDRLISNIVYINTASPELGDPLVRRALALGVDREALVESGFFGFGEPMRGVFPDGFWAEPPEGVGYDYDPDEARRLLAEAGQESVSFDLAVIANAQYTRIAEILQEQWAEIGVTVNILPREVVQQNQEFFVEGKHPASLTQMQPGPDPAKTYSGGFSSTGFYNASKVAPPGLEEALAEQNELTTQEERKPGLDRAAQALFDYSAAIPLTSSVGLVGLGEGVTGFELSLVGKPKFIGVSLE